MVAESQEGLEGRGYYIGRTIGRRFVRTVLYRGWRARSPVLKLAVWLLMIWGTVIYFYGGQHQIVTGRVDSITPKSEGIEIGGTEKLQDHGESSESNSAGTFSSSIAVADEKDSEPSNEKTEVLLPSNVYNSAEKLATPETVYEQSKEESIEPAANSSTETIAHVKESSQQSAESTADRGAIISSNKPEYRVINSVYLQLVQRLVSNEWKPPKVPKPLKAVILFRLERSGDVLEVAIERSSGDEYFDLAAKRAVLSASPLPSFPPEIDEAFLNAHVSFASDDR